MSDAGYWKTQIKAAARAQNAFLWVLLALGVFYWSLGSPEQLPVHERVKPVVLPFIGLDLPRLPVWGTAPAVLFFLLLAIYGTIRTCNRALAELASVAPNEKEPDLEPNVLDYAIRTTDASPRLVKKVLRFAYPAYLTIFVIEASSLTLDLATAQSEVPGRWVLLALAAIQGVPAYALTYLFWRGRLRDVFGIRSAA